MARRRRRRDDPRGAGLRRSVLAEKRNPFSPLCPVSTFPRAGREAARVCAGLSSGSGPKQTEAYSSGNPGEGTGSDEATSALRLSDVDCLPRGAHSSGALSLIPGAGHAVPLCPRAQSPAGIRALAGACLLPSTCPGEASGDSGRSRPRVPAGPPPIRGPAGSLPVSGERQKSTDPDCLRVSRFI